MPNVDSLGTLAANQAMKAAADWFRQNKMVEIDYQRATDLIREHARRALPQALADAKDAIDARMSSAASATFSASFRLAGINAAKEYAGL